MNYMEGLKVELQATLRSLVPSRSTVCEEVGGEAPTAVDETESKLQQEVEDLAAERGFLLQSVDALRGTMPPGAADCLNVSAADTLAVPLSGPLVVTHLINRKIICWHKFHSKTCVLKEHHLQVEDQHAEVMSFSEAVASIQLLF